MNRAQRRAKPQKVGRQFSVYEATVQRQATLMSARTNDLSERDRNRLMLLAYAALTALESGDGEDDHFVQSVRFNAHGRLLAQRLHDHGNTPQAFAATEAIFVAATDALSAVGARKETRGSYSVATKEAVSIRESIETLGELLALTPEGHAVAALAEADRMTRAMLRKKIKRG